MFKSAKKIIVIVFTAFLGISAFAESTHLVKKGETLYGIAKKYQITISELKAANNLSDKDVLKAGQKLVIPSADIENAATLSSTNSSASTSNSSSKTETYIVQKGDSMASICRKIYQTTAMMDEVCKANDIDDPDSIYAGQYLTLPN